MSGPRAELFLARQDSLRASMAAAELDGLVVSSLPNVTYLTGLVASSAVCLITDQHCWLISDGRYAQALRDRAAALPGLTSREVGGDGTADAVLAGLVAEAGGRRLGFEGAHVSVRQFRSLQAAVGPGLDWIETHQMVELLRAVKDTWEIATLREAATRLSDAAKCILSNRLAGLREREVASMVEDELARVGFSRPAFDTIVASGPNAALPHHRAGTRQLADGDIVVLDFGGVWQGYAVDLSRTCVMGRPSPRQAGWIEAVAAAQDAAIAAVGPGTAPEEVDAAARARLRAAGLDGYFTHGTGHGLGLEVHELPRVGRKRPGISEPPLAAGMVLTVEPGVYLPGEGGVRIEDDVLVTPEGRELLTEVPRMV